MENRQITTFLTNTCNLGYKQCLQTDTMETCAFLMEECKETKQFRKPEPIKKVTPKKQKPLRFNKKDNQVNLRRCKKKKFYDAAICRHLCSSSIILTSKRSSTSNSCEEICFELTRSSESGEICPFQKYCPDGCPCKNYVCEKISYKDQQEVPVWDLESKTSDYNKTVVNLDLNIFQRRKELNREPKTSGFRISLYDLSSTNSASQVYVEADVLYPYEWIDLFHF